MRRATYACLMERTKVVLRKRPVSCPLAPLSDAGVSTHCVENAQDDVAEVVRTGGVGEWVGRGGLGRSGWVGGG